MSYVLGVNLSHDRSVCLVRDGQIVAAIEEERLDRFKYSPGFIFQNSKKGFNIQKITPMKGITYCLEMVGIGLDDLDLVVVDKAELNYGPDLLKRELPIKDKSKIVGLPTPSHHLAHAYSVYYCSPFKESAIIVADNKGTHIDDAAEAESIFYGDENGLKVIKKRLRTSQEISLGSMYDIVSKEIGFAIPVVDKGPESPEERFSLMNVITECGKTMGLAPFGKHRSEWQPIVFDDAKQVISIPVKNLVLNLLKWSSEAEISEGPTYEQKYYQDLAYKVQEELEKGMIKLAQYAYTKTQSKNLCLVGGVALNSVANRKVLKESPFENIFILPPANDAGNAIGCAMYGYHVLLKGTERFSMESASCGKSYSAEVVLNSIEKRKDELQYERADLSKVAELLTEGKVIGWFKGGVEIGPRALGNRSILADARNPKMKDYLNHSVKFREPFRPYAPVILEEDVAEYFDIDQPSPFMLLVCDVLTDKHNLIPATTHIDGTARIQTVSERVNGDYYQLIKIFKELTGVPVILNTSFNLSGEPIVETPDDAIDCYLRSKIDNLYLENYLISRVERG